MSFGFVFALVLLLSLSVPSLAADMDYVADIADILSYDEWDELEQRAAQISQCLGCGVYVVTVDNYKDYGTGNVYDVTTQIYNDTENNFGIGNNRDGIILLLSMYERDYALFVHGEQAEYAFNEYGQEQLEKVFLDDFKEDDWFNGLSDYLDTCSEYLEKAADGKPVRKSPVFHIMCAIGVSMFLALVVCMVQKNKMKTVHKKVEADAYASSSVTITGRHDQFTHMMETRHRIESSSDSSNSESGGGGSGRSGKF